AGSVVRVAARPSRETVADRAGFGMAGPRGGPPRPALHLGGKCPGASREKWNGPGGRAGAGDLGRARSVSDGGIGRVLAREVHPVAHAPGSPIHRQSTPPRVISYCPLPVSESTVFWF